MKTKAVLSKEEPRDAAVNFDRYRILQQHCAVSLPQHGFLVYISDRTNAEIATHIYANFHGRDAESRRYPKGTAHDQNYGIQVTVIVNTWLSDSANKCYNKCPASLVSNCLLPIIGYFRFIRLATINK